MMWLPAMDETLLDPNFTVNGVAETLLAYVIAFDYLIMRVRGLRYGQAFLRCQAGIEPALNMPCHSATSLHDRRRRMKLQPSSD